jgi:ATP-dependent Zn protease
MFYDIKKGIQLIIDLYENIENTDDKNNIKKNYEYFDRLGLNVTLLKSNIDKNVELINYFDLNNLLSYTNHEISCESESICKLSINSNNSTIVSNLNKKILYLKNHVLYISSPEHNCIIIANDYNKKNTVGASSNFIILIVFIIICMILSCGFSFMMFLQNRKRMGYETYNYTDTF